MLGVFVVRQMIAAIILQMPANRRAAQPLADKIIHSSVAAKPAMCAFMHQYRKAQLARMVPLVQLANKDLRAHKALPARKAPLALRARKESKAFPARMVLEYPSSGRYRRKMTFPVEVTTRVT